MGPPVFFSGAASAPCNFGKALRSDVFATIGLCEGSLGPSTQAWKKTASGSGYYTSTT